MSTDTEDKNEKAVVSDNDINNNKTNDNELVSVCEKLDVLALEYLDKMEQYSNNMNRASDHFQQGFLQLAHAKYAMGTNKISPLYYDERMKAQTRVCIDDATGSITFLNGPFDETKEEEEEEEEKIKKDPSAMPRRRKNASAAQKKEDRDVDDDNKENEPPAAGRPMTATTRKNKTINKNPLHWFGLFVSPSLRESQTHFIKATHELLDNIACLKDLESLEKEYLALAEQKMKIPLLKQVQDRKD